MASTRASARSLADWLRGWSDGELAALVDARPDLVAPVPSDISVLATRIADRVHVSRALDGLDRYALQVLDALLLGEDPAPLLGPEAVPVLDRLEDLALVWDRPQRVVAGVPAAIPRPAGLGRPASQLYRRTDRTVLSGMLAGNRLPPTADRDEAATRLGRVLALPDDPEELRVLTAVDAGGGIGQVAGAMAATDPDDPSPVRRLIARGRLVPLDDSTVELPRELGTALRTVLITPMPEPPPLEPEPSRGDLDAAGALEAAELVRLTALLVDALGDDPPLERKSGGLGARDLRALARALGATEQTTALVAEIAYAAGLLGRTTAVDAAFAPTHDADGWLREELPERWDRLARAWLTSPGVVAAVGDRDERDAVVTALGQQAYRPAARELRASLLEVLAAADGPVTRASVLTRLAWLTPRRMTAYLPLVDPTLAEATLLGIVAGGGITSFGRALLTGPAAAALGAAMPPPVDHVLLQADHTAVAPGPLPTDLARDMALVADVESPGSATVYRFTPATLRRALDAGWTAAEVHAFLERVGRGGVPQGLSYLVDDTARRHGLLRAGVAGAYLRCDDEQLLTEVVTDPKLEGLRLRRIAPTVLIAAAAPGPLVEALRAAGYAPVGERADGGVTVIGRERARAARGVGPTFPGRGDPARIVAALRAGEAAARAGRSERSGISSTLALLEGAAAAGGQVLLGYVNAQGQESRRIVEPQSVAAGLLTAYDHRTQEQRSFALHRITEVQPVDPGDVVA